MAPKKRRRVASGGTASVTDNARNTARWAELPREIVAMIASYTCTAVHPLPFTCLSRAADSGFTPYRRQEDRANAHSQGGQFVLDVPAAPTILAGPGPAATHAAAAAAAAGQDQQQQAPHQHQHQLPEAVAAVAVKSGSRGSEGGASGSAGGSTTGGASGGSGGGVAAPVPGVFRPVRMSDAALAMRCVCRLWCAVLSEGVRRIEVHDTRPVTLWPSHFPHIAQLSLGCCTDFGVRHDEEEEDDATAAAAAGPGPSRGGGASRRRNPSRGASRRGGGEAAAAAAGGGGPRCRSLASLTCLRDLQVMDTAVHLDLAASCGPSLEELVVAAQHLQLGRNNIAAASFAAAGGRGGGGGYGMYGSRGRGGGGGDGPPAVTRRSALDQTLSRLPGLKRLRLHGLDASAARLGSALMELRELTSLRLMDCRLPTYFARQGGGGRGRGGGGGGRGGHSSFGRELVMNLGAKLRDLSLQGCYLRDMPAEVLAGLAGLRWLDLSYNALTQLPHTLTQLGQLEYLELQNNQLSTLPPGMAALTRLADLDLSENLLHRLPPDFGDLTGLTHLHLGGMHGLDMDACCPLLTRLTNLHSLGLYDVDLSASMQAVHHHQDGAGNQADGGHLAQLAAAFGPVGRLRELVLDGCGLDRLPTNFSDLTSLSHLSITENFDASTVPEAVTHLRGLAVLKLGYLDLAAPLPAGLFELTQLRELDLEQNFLPYLQPDISKLSRLQVLNLVDAFDPDVEGEVLPWPQLYRLTRLRRLGVSGQEERPQRVQPGIGQLAALEDLDLRHVDLPAAVLEELCHHVRDLTSLDVSCCGLRALPPAITKLTRLEVLQLTRNQLTRLPPGLGALSRLVDLELGSNPRLKSLPPDVTRLTRLRCLCWSVGPATAPPSPQQLAWLAGLPELVMHGSCNFAELAKTHGVAWPKRPVYF